MTSINQDTTSKTRPSWTALHRGSRWKRYPGDHDPTKVPSPIAEAIVDCVTGVAPWPLVLIGDSGVGKTAAAKCVLDLFGSRKAFMAHDLSASLRDARCGEIGAERRLWREIETVGVVLLDDIGARERVGDSAYDAVKITLDMRDGQPLVITSNMGIKRLEQLYDMRVVSRLMAGRAPDLSKLPDMRRVRIAGGKA